jgi:effector-binding domain-containing protein
VAWNFELKALASRPTLSKRLMTSMMQLPQVIGTTYMDICNYLARIGEAVTEAPFSAYHNMDMANLDVEIGFPLGHPVPGEGELKAGEIQAGQFATCLYKGKYSDMEPMYGELIQWIASNNLEPAGACYEFYLNSPDEVPESELLTRIEWPVKRNS